MRPRRGFRRFRPGVGRGRYPQGDKPGSGPGGNCICPSCGHKMKHTWATPCNTKKCPKCGATMTRE